MTGEMTPFAEARLLELWEGPGGDSADVRPILKRLLTASAAFLLVFLLAAVVPIGGAVIGSGSLAAESRVKRIAHPTGGVIAEIRVANGQAVKRGELLMRLDDRVVGADSRYADVSLEQLLAQRARLEAERLGRSSIDFPPQLAAKNSPSARAAIADERNLFVLRRAEQGRIGAQLAARTSQLNDQIAGYRAQIASLQKQRELIQPELQGLRDLWERRLVTIGRLNQLERAAIDLDGNIASLEAQIASTGGEIAQVQQQSMQLAATRRAEAGQELSNLNIALNQQQFRAVAAADQQSRREIRAPYAGTVEKLAFAAKGEVVRPAETIMEIVPTADQLIVEVAIDPSDVDQVRVGQSASVLFPSINRAATPTLPGSVVYVAADRSTDPERRSSFFLARVSLEPADVRAARLNLQSGMPAEVHIQTRSRTLLSYILKPLADQFARAFRDG